MQELSVEQVQEALKRGIDFFIDLDAQIMSFLGRLAELLEEEHDLAPFKKPFAKNARRTSIVQSYVLILRPTGAEVDGEDEADDDDTNEEDASDRRELTFSADANLPYVIVQLQGRPAAKATGDATVPFIQFGTIRVTGRHDGKPLDDGPIVMRGGYYSGVFRNRVCNPAKKPPYTHKSKRGGVTLRFEEGPTSVMPLGAIRREDDIVALAARVAELAAQ